MLKVLQLSHVLEPLKVPSQQMMVLPYAPLPLINIGWLRTFKQQRDQEPTKINQDQKQLRIERRRQLVFSITIFQFLRALRK